jgi:hypothetical protein
MGQGLESSTCYSFSIWWGGEASHKLGVQSADVSALPDVFPQSSVSPASYQSPWITEVRRSGLCSSHHLGSSFGELEWTNWEMNKSWWAYTVSTSNLLICLLQNHTSHWSLLCITDISKYLHISYHLFFTIPQNYYYPHFINKVIIHQNVITSKITQKTKDRIKIITINF